MKKLKNAIQESLTFWFIILFVFIAALVFLFTNSKADGFLELTPFHDEPFDVFFTWFTYLGDGIVILSLVVVLLLAKETLLSAGIFLSYCLSGITAQILKYIHPSPRPAIYFTSLKRTFYSIPHVTLTASNASFPSGHTACIFAVLTVLILFYPKSKWNFLFIFLALAVGYSRMYLSNHFLTDVLSGALIGLYTGALAFELLRRLFLKKPTWFLIK